VFNATFNNISVISWRSVLLVKETGVLHCNNKCIVHVYSVMITVFNSTFNSYIVAVRLNGEIHMYVAIHFGDSMWSF